MAANGTRKVDNFLAASSSRFGMAPLYPSRTQTHSEQFLQDGVYWHGNLFGPAYWKAGSGGVVLEYDKSMAGRVLGLYDLNDRDSHFADLV